ncbi:MAG: fibronectin type III domain-containing protein [Candidatus Kerfeldbacteria bacterium]|nr:fibronectin type III domain-containing protein [Candidatus Kerfeldbacteria bacterium]
MKRNLLLMTAIMLCFSFGSQSVHALTVNSFDCSGIDTTDGNVADWENINYLIDTDETVDGTISYLDSDTGEWTNEEPENWRYSANLTQQANIQQMKVCNTDTFFMMLRTEEPMMYFYDQEQDQYVDFWSRMENEDGSDGGNFTLPADYHYWMVWKVQDIAGEGSIMYFAADLTMDEGRELNGDSEENDRVPKLYLYEESDEDVTFDDAMFDPNEDTELQTIDLSEDEQSCDSNDASDDAECNADIVSKEDYAFEVSQDISELFKYADFKYGDTVNLSAAMYNSDTFSDSSGRAVLTLADETATEQYTFTQRAVRHLSGDEEKITDRSAVLTWVKMKGAKSYQIKLLNPKNDQTIRVIKNIKTRRHTVRALQANTQYRAIVRAVLGKKENGKQQFSAWSSGFKWTTAEDIVE